MTRNPQLTPYPVRKCHAAQTIHTAHDWCRVHIRRLLAGSDVSVTDSGSEECFRRGHPRGMTAANASLLHCRRGSSGTREPESVATRPQGHCRSATMPCLTGPGRTAQRIGKLGPGDPGNGFLVLVQSNRRRSEPPRHGSEASGCQTARSRGDRLWFRPSFRIGSRTCIPCQSRGFHEGACPDVY